MFVDVVMDLMFLTGLRYVSSSSLVRQRDFGRSPLGDLHQQALLREIF